jgi:hypothetical protein
MPKCYNCPKPALYGFGDPGKEVPLCLDCSLKHTQMISLQQAESERAMNYLADQFEMITGVPGVVPRFPQRKVNITQGANVAFHNINISNSNIGVLNTGHLEIINSAITQLNQETGSEAVSAAISALTSAIGSSNELSTEKKNEAVEILSVIASEATVPKENRRGAILRPLLTSLSDIIQSAAGLMQIWQSVAPAITQYFGLT